MNLKEAAGILRRYETDIALRIHPDDDLFDATFEARYVLERTMLAEMDPSEISKELLVRNGWQQEQSSLVGFKNANNSLWKRGHDWVLFIENERFLVKTMGELATLLRLKTI